MVNKITDLLPGVQANISLALHTTFCIGGKAKYFFIAKTKQDIISAIQTAKISKISFFILGGGSNVLASDKGYDGLVIKIQSASWRIKNLKLYTDAGVSLATLVEETTKRGLAGLEWAGGLPGSLGGAVRGNAGAFGGEIKDAILNVECVDQKGNIKTLSKEQCKFSYRSSLFKEKKLIVLSAVFALKRESAKKIQEIAKAHINYRKEKHPLEFPNAGSIFKNCDFKKIPSSMHEFVKPVLKNDPFPVVPTAFLLSKAGLQGMKERNAQVSDKHPNYIVNKGKASAKDVTLLIKKVKKVIKKKLSIDLEEEIEVL